LTPPPREIWHFDTARVGRRVLVYDTVSSTNDLAAELAAAGEDSGTLVLANFQSRGRGQYGRTWSSRPGCSLLVSVILRPEPELNRPAVLTAWAAVAVGNAVAHMTGVTPAIKWPNDLIAKGRKIAGVLIEQTAAAVVGIGLNLNQTGDDWRAEGLPAAVSIAELCGNAVDPHAAAGVLVKHLDDTFTQLALLGPANLETAWRRRLGLLGRHVVATLADGQTVAGTLRHLSFAGIELDSGDGGFRVLVPERVRSLSGDEIACPA
jgi:BirA family transcriptional regulator, biotin operon repressor / biotin---[acetyl-CoA-carboxylase] ligase